jgi:hypothetical protein
MRTQSFADIDIFARDTQTHGIDPIVMRFALRR